MKLPAKWLTCPGIENDGREGHNMRDFCWSCAPFWEQYPVCPKDSEHGRLKQSGWCGGCRKYYDVLNSRPPIKEGKQ